MYCQEIQALRVSVVSKHEVDISVLSIVLALVAAHVEVPYLQKVVPPVVVVWALVHKVSDSAFSQVTEVIPRTPRVVELFAVNERKRFSDETSVRKAKVA